MCIGVLLLILSNFVLIRFHTRWCYRIFEKVVVAFQWLTHEAKSHTNHLQNNWSHNHLQVVSHLFVKLWRKNALTTPCCPSLRISNLHKWAFNYTTRLELRNDELSTSICYMFVIQDSFPQCRNSMAFAWMCSKLQSTISMDLHLMCFGL
jgi:hypothetical protein